MDVVLGMGFCQGLEAMGNARYCIKQWYKSKASSKEKCLLWGRQGTRGICRVGIACSNRLGMSNWR